MAGDLVLVGYTNGYQLENAREDAGIFFHNTDHGCRLPVYVKASDAALVSETSNGEVTLDGLPPLHE